MADFGLTTGQIRSLVEEPKETLAGHLADLGGIDGIAQKLQVDPKVGINENDEADLARRREVFGPNRIPVPRAATLWELMWDALHDPILIILMVAGTISLVIGVAFEEDKSTAWIEGFAILVAVFVVTLVSSLNDYQKERQFRKLNAVKEDYKVNVVRGGQIVQVSKFDIVVGDIVVLAQGDEIVADGLVVESASLKVNESSLTGESDDIKKSRETAPVLFSGTQVMDGVGSMLVLAVGVNSQTGIITALINGQAVNDKEDVKVDKKGKGRASVNSQHDANGYGAGGRTSTAKKEPIGDTAEIQVVDVNDVGGPSHLAINMERRNSRPDQISLKRSSSVDSEAGGDDDEGDTVLQQKLEKLVVLLGYLGLAVAVMTFVVLTIRYCIETYTVRGWEKKDFQEFLDFFIIGITVLVVAVPEGLPLAVTLSLAFSMKQMLKENNLVRHLDACETMGSATTICSDKTGTLTTNRMAVAKGIIAQKEIGPDGDANGVSASVMAIFTEGVAVNSTAEVQVPKSGVGPNEHIGSKTECALLQYIIDRKANYHEIRNTHKLIALFPFSSARKSMGILIKTTTTDGRTVYRLHVKGASEIILGRCTNYIDSNGSTVPLNEGVRITMLDNIEKLAAESLRTICLAYRDFDPSTRPESEWESAAVEELDRDLTCVGVVGIEDPVRPEVPRAIEQCKRAGITVRMVTGDNVTTARAVANKCGIVRSDEDIVMEGPDFRKRVLDSNGNIIQSEMDKIWPNLRVLARSSPTDKHTLVSGILASNLGNDKQVVAVTGDGTNDAPALKRADVGFAMGIQGTSVAKNASDIILMDDNFNSIVAAVKWGRNVYDSISKFVQFQMTVNVSALVLAFFSSCVVEQSAVTAVQLLWINLVMDTLASLALATEKPTDALLDRQPYGRSKSLISRRMWKFVLGHSLYQTVILFWLVFAGHTTFGLENGRGLNRSEHYTMVFNTFALCQFANEINARKLHGELNVFAGITQNMYYIVIMLAQLATQIVIVQFGGEAFSVVPLSGKLWGWCILFAAFELVWNLFLNLLPKLVPKSWKVKMARPLSRSFWSARGRGLRTRVPFFRRKKDALREERQRRHIDIDALMQRPHHMSFYESALHMLLRDSSRHPRQRLRAAVRIITTRLQAEHEEEKTKLLAARASTS